MDAPFWGAYLRRLMEQRLDRLEEYLNNLTNREEEHTNGAKHQHNGNGGPPGHDHPDAQRPT